VPTSKGLKSIAFTQVRPEKHLPCLKGKEVTYIVAVIQVEMHS